MRSLALPVMLALALAAVSSCARTSSDAVAQDDSEETSSKQGAADGGRQAYLDNCAICHGENLEGKPSMHAPNLTDGIWLIASDDLDAPYGVLYPADIEYTIRYGIRGGHAGTRLLPEMPSLGHRLTESEISDVAEYVLQLAGDDVDEEKAARGAIIYDDEGECFDCHGWSGRGDGAIGSTDFTRDLWLWGKDRETIMASVRSGRKGVCPGFDEKLNDETVNTIAAYVLTQNPSPGPK